MSFINPATIEERIVEHLRAGSRKTTELLALVGEEGAITKQGFYAALRKLDQEEAVTVYKKNVSLNAAWIKDLVSLAEDVRQAYLPGQAHEGILNLAQGESVTYVFLNTRHLDTFWGHTQSQIIDQTPLTEPVYTYDPHYWFYLARAATEKKIVSDIAKSGRQFLMTAGGEDPLDKLLQDDFSSDTLQYHMEELFPERNRYIVVIGEYITEAHLDMRVVNEVDALYRTHQALDADAVQEFKRLLTMKARHKIRISRNPRRANALKRKFGKNFYVRARSE